MLALLLRAVQW